MTVEPPEQRSGVIAEAVKLAQSISLSQALVIALLVAIAIPSYIVWRVINDESMLTKFTSRYEEIASAYMPCTLRVASVRGGGDTYSISTGFAFQGSDRWTVGVIMQRLPEQGDQIAYCNTLNLLVDHLRRPDAPGEDPKFPGTDEPLIWPYPPGEQP